MLTLQSDPIEAGSFSTVLAEGRSSENPLYIGSLKSNFGCVYRETERLYDYSLIPVSRHLEGASGILGMIKAVLMVQQACILPNAGFDHFNERIEGKEKLRVCN